jgi:pentatricopeptide repeat protein
MKDSINDIQRIEKFLEGKMSEEEKKEFENKLNLDQSLNAMMTDVNLLVEGIKMSAAQTSKEEKSDRLKFFAEINDIEKHAFEIPEPEARVVPMYRKPWVLSAAASVMLLVTLTFYLMRDQTPINEQLYAAYFEPFDSPGSGLTRGTNEVTIKTEAYQAYDNGNYKVAAQLFEQIISEKEDAIAQLCLGNAYLKQNDFVKAEKIFTEMLTKHSELLTQAKWYLALTYLKENKLERAKAILWQISKSSTYGEKAQKLLKKLD